MSERLEAYLEEKDIVKVRGELIKILMVNPRVSDGVFKKALQKAHCKLGETLYEESNNTFEKKQDKTEWTADYLSEIIIELRSEFSKDLVEHAVRVADVVYPNRNVGGDLDQKQPIQVDRKEGKGKLVIIGIGIVAILLFVKYVIL